jgi:hypothetical protein
MKKYRKTPSSLIPLFRKCMDTNLHSLRIRIKRMRIQKAAFFLGIFPFFIFTFDDEALIPGGGGTPPHFPHGADFWRMWIRDAGRKLMRIRNTAWYFDEAIAVKFVPHNL